METISATKFKAQCLSLLNRIAPDGLIITKHGKPVAKLVPIQTGSAHLIGSMKNTLRIHGPIFSTDRKWSSES